MLRNGFQELTSTTAMFLESSKITEETCELARDDENVSIRKAVDPEALREFAIITAVESGAPAEMITFYSHMQSRILSPTCRVSIYIAYCGDKPAGAGALCFSDTSAGLYCISVSPEFRKRGIGTKLAARMIMESLAKKKKVIVLQSTEMGRSI